MAVSTIAPSRATQPTASPRTGASTSTDSATRAGVSRALRSTCRGLEGAPIEHGGAGFAFRVLPRVEIAAVYWPGDEELPSKASILFDATAHHYMVVDGLAILGSRLVGRLLDAK
jgi:hypothetical protein